MWVLGQGDVRNEAQRRVAAGSGEVDARSEHASRASPPSDVDGSGFVLGDDFVIVTRRWHAKEIEKQLRSK